MTIRPTVGRVVHYISYGSPILPDGSQKYKPQVRAAIITDVPKHLSVEPYDGCPNGTEDNEDLPMWEVGLCILNPTGMFFDTCVPYSENNAPGSWNWPSRS